jgi:hypothetical protein
MAGARFFPGRVATPLTEDAFLWAIADALHRMCASALEVVVVRVVWAAATEALVLTWGKPALGRGEVVAHLMAAGALN